MKLVYTGVESSGKSLRLAMIAQDIVIRNGKWKDKSGKMRPILSNMKFSDKFEEFAKSYGIEIIYWEDLDVLMQYRDCDVFIDEIGNYFDARLWENLSTDVRSWVRQTAKLGVEMYCAAQDFGQIDKSFRLLTNQVFQITKWVGSRRPSNTRPPIKHIWGVCTEWEIDVKSYKGNEPEMKKAFWFPSVFFIERHYCDIFDTLQRIKPTTRVRKRHIDYYCATCPWKHTAHY